MNKKTTCILFSDSYEQSYNPLAAQRTLASVPFGGRYCLVDFLLSSLVAAGLSDIGVLTKGRYGSLVDHLGWGKDWDLNRKDGGLKVLTPFADADTVSTRDRSRIDALLSCRPFLEKSSAEHFLLSDTNLVINIDFEKMLQFHQREDADITVLYRKYQSKEFSGVDLTCDREGRVIDAVFRSGQVNDYENGLLPVFLFRRELLLELLDRAYTFGWTEFIRDFITRSIQKRKVVGFEHKGFSRVIDSARGYYEASMALLDPEVRKDLFSSGTAILTNVKNTVPTRYGFESHVQNSLVSDGCHIEGTVKNSILFRGVTVKKGAFVENSILFSKTSVEENAFLSAVIADKSVRVTEGKKLLGQPEHPFVIAKGTLI